MLTPPVHGLARADFDTLAAGLGSASTIGALASAGLSRRMMMLRAMLDAAEQAGHKEAVPGFDLLTEVQRSDPAAVNAVLCYPLTGSWLAHCLRRLDPEAVAGTADRAGLPAAPGLPAALGQLGALAAAAAMRAGVPFSIDVPVHQGAAYLPGLGRVLVDDGDVATVSGDGRTTTANGVPLAGGPGWQPLRRLTAQADGLRLAVTLDDVDPYRSTALPVTQRLSGQDVDAWDHWLARAWGVLVGHYREYAQAIAAGLTVIVPLAAGRLHRGLNATSREAFGAAAISPPADAHTLAIALLHEFQHGKLYAVMDMFELHHRDDARFYAPWRQDPRPFGGLLHGAYAHLGVVDFWRVQATLPGTPHPGFARFEYARWAADTERAIGTLLGSGALTAAGERFVLGMRERLRGLTEPVPDDISDLAELVRADHRLGWRLRNIRPDDAAIVALARAWLEGAPPRGPIPLEIVDGGSKLGADARLDLLFTRLREPGELDVIATRIGAGRPDVDLIAGDTAAAVAGYRRRIAADPGDLASWAGLALGLRRTGRCPDALLDGPEVVRAVYSRLAREAPAPAADPERLAAWLGPVVPSDPFRVLAMRLPVRQLHLQFDERTGFGQHDLRVARAELVP